MASPLRAEAIPLQNVVVVAAEEVDIPAGRAHEFTVPVPEMAAGHDLIVEFEAWYRAPKMAGFYASMQIFWNEREIVDLLDRPLRFSIRDGREFEMRGPRGWRVPLAASPEEIAAAVQSPYAVVEEGVRVALFRFEVPDALGAHGEYGLKIRNGLSRGLEEKGAPAMLVVRQVKVGTLPK